jgi:hypothetical protein
MVEEGIPERPDEAARRPAVARWKMTQRHREGDRRPGVGLEAPEVVGEVPWLRAGQRPDGTTRVMQRGRGKMPRGGLNRVWLGFLVRAPLLYPSSPGLWGWVHKTTRAFVQRCEVTISNRDGRCAYGLGALRSGQSRFGFQLQFIPNIHDRALNMRPELRSEQEVREDKEIDKSECSISFGTNRLFCGKT